MKLYMPTEVYCEDNCVLNHSKELVWGDKAMIVTGKHSSKINGSLKDVEDALKKENTDYVIFNEIEENPSVETVVKAAKLAVDEQVDFFIGVGGGSPMDAAKAISLLAMNEDEIDNAEEFLYEGQTSPWYPLVCIPTTCGTGSEVTQHSVLTRHSKQTKKGIEHDVFADVALIDIKYLKTASYETMVSTAVDALAHLVESFLNTNSNEYNRIYAREGFRIWGQAKENLLTEESFNNMTDDDYGLFMHASVLAGMSIAHAGTCIPHGLSYPITYDLGIPHGKAVGIFLPGFVDNCPGKEDVKTMLELLGFDNVKDFGKFLKQILGKVDISSELWEKDVQMLMQNPGKLKNYPYEMTEEILRTYIEYI